MLGKKKSQFKTNMFLKIILNTCDIGISTLFSIYN